MSKSLKGYKSKSRKVQKSKRPTPPAAQTHGLDMLTLGLSELCLCVFELLHVVEAYVMMQYRIL